MEQLGTRILLTKQIQSFPTLSSLLFILQGLLQAGLQVFVDLVLCG
jgi:hypothetical protein